MSWTPSEFAELFDEHFDRVYGYVAMRVMPDRQAAEDITQAVFLEAWRTRSGFRGRSKVSTWLRAVARNKVTDHFRGSSARGRAQKNWVAIQRQAGETDSQRKGNADTADRVRRVLKRLPEHQATLLKQKYLDGLSLEAIAVLRRQTPAAVGSALFRARRAFGEAYRGLIRVEEVDA